MTQQTTNASQTNGNAAPNAAEPKAAEAKGLDGLLKEFETSTANKPVDALKAFQPVIEFATQEMQTRQEEALRADVAESVKSIKAGLQLTDEFPDKAVRGYLYDYANENKEFADAWDNRAKAPDAWKAQLEKAAKDFKEEIVGKLPTNTVRTEIDAAAAAVRNVSTAPQQMQRVDNVTAMNMSDRDWKIYKQKLLAQQGA